MTNAQQAELETSILNAVEMVAMQDARKGNTQGRKMASLRTAVAKHINGPKWARIATFIDADLETEIDNLYGTALRAFSGKGV